MTEQFPEALTKAVDEYKKVYKDMKFIKKTEARTSACNMAFMRGRDIERENIKPEDGHRKFCFTISTYNPDQQKWDRCPGCGDPEINKESNGHEWQGCYKCDILLDSSGKIRSMDHNKKKGKPKEDKQPEPEFQTASEMVEGK